MKFEIRKKFNSAAKKTGMDNLFYSLKTECNAERARIKKNKKKTMIMIVRI